MVVCVTVSGKVGWYVRCSLKQENNLVYLWT